MNNINSSHQPLSFTVGIPTYYGGPALVKAVESLMASERVQPFRLIVTVDGNPLDETIEKQLKQLGAEIIFNQERGGQVTRIKQLISLCETDILVLTQDDIIFEKNALEKIINVFKSNPDTTMVGARVLAKKSETFMEKVIEIGVSMTHSISDMWNRGDNFLSASGRCLAFRTPHVKKFTIREEVINSDAYLYFENKKTGGTFQSAVEAKVYNKSPQKIKEYIKQNKKFEISFMENSRYFGKEIEKEYRIPKTYMIKAYAKEFIRSPVLSSSYAMLYCYVNTQKNPYKNASRFWDTDMSTKRV